MRQAGKLGVDDAKRCQIGKIRPSVGDDWQGQILNKKLLQMTKITYKIKRNGRGEVGNM